MATWINIIPTDYAGDATKALGYCIGGVDVAVNDKASWRSAAECKMRELGIEGASINCMWCGGFCGEIEAEESGMPAKADNVQSDAVAIRAERDYIRHVTAVYAMAAGGEAMDISDRDNSPAHPVDW